MTVGGATLRDPLSVGTRADELTGDAAFLDALVAVEIAMVRAAVDSGIAPPWMLEVCDDLERGAVVGVADAAAQGRAGGNPVIPLVGALRAAADARRPGAGDHLHLGATSQDVLDTATSLVARGVIDEVTRQSLRLGRALVDLAERHRDTPMVGRTLGQHASPTRFGFVAAGWLDQTVASVERLLAVRTALPVQWGGSVGDAAVLDRLMLDRLMLDRPATIALDGPRPVESLARRLGLAVPAIAWHSDRSVVADLGSALSLAIGAAGRLALEVTVLARTELGEVSERQAADGGGSSAMPHKSNPITAVLVVGAARRAPGLLATLHSALLGEDQRSTGAWHSEWATVADLERTAIAVTTGAADLAGRLEVHEERMRANLAATGGLVSSELASAVLAAGLGRTESLALVRHAVDASADGGFRDRLLADLPDDGLRQRITAVVDEGSPSHPDSTAARAVGAATDRFATVVRTVEAHLARGAAA